MYLAAREKLIVRSERETRHRITSLQIFPRKLIRRLFQRFGAKKSKGKNIKSTRKQCSAETSTGS